VCTAGTICLQLIVAEEREALLDTPRDSVGESFDVSASPDELVEAMIHRLGLQ